MAVKLLDLVEQNSECKEEFIKKFSEILDSGIFILGEEVENFESSVSAYLSCKHVLGVSSGTDALLLALMAMDIKSGDEILCPAYSFFATAGCIARLGAKPIFVDVNYEDFCLSMEGLENKITNNTKAIICVHLFGQSCICEKITAICEKKGIKLIEDCAQSFGAKRNGKQTGTFGDIGCFSFFPSKNLGGFGDSGLVCTGDDDLYDRMKILRTHGAYPQYFHKKIGGNFRIDTLQAALLNIKLRKIDEYIALRRKNAKIYLSELDNLDGKHLILPRENENNFHTWNQFTIKVPKDKRDGLKQWLLDSGISCSVYYPLPLNKQECFAMYKNHVPISEQLSTEALSIPIYPELKQKQLLEVTQAISAFFEAPSQ